MEKANRPMLGGEMAFSFPLIPEVYQHAGSSGKDRIVTHPCAAPDTEQFVMVSNHVGYFDESGKLADNSIVAFCGLVNTSERWEPFKSEWAYLLRHYGLSSLHMSAGKLNFKKKLSDKRPALGREERLQVLTRFILVIKQFVELGVVIDVDIRAYQEMKTHLKQKTGDPYFMAFRTALLTTIDYIKSQPDAALNIVCDDEEQYSPLCYKLFNKARRQYPDLRKFLASICFGDDNLILQLQAADLLAYIVRSHSAFRFHSQHNECEELHAKLLAVEPGDKIIFKGGTWVFHETLEAFR